MTGLIEKKACVVCGKMFVPHHPTIKFCSHKCREVSHTYEYRFTRKNKKQIKKAAVIAPRACTVCGEMFTPKTSRLRICSDECRRVSNLISNKKQRLKQCRQKTSTNDRRGVETVPVDQMFELNRNAPKHDREKLDRAAIQSPDLSAAQFRYYDPRLKITRFFDTRERYERFLKTLNEQES